MEIVTIDQLPEGASPLEVDLEQAALPGQVPQRARAVEMQIDMADPLGPEVDVLGRPGSREGGLHGILAVGPPVSRLPRRSNTRKPPSGLARGLCWMGQLPRELSIAGSADGEP
jgi:hypothetical protein